MARWQYRVRRTNINRYDEWADVYETVTSLGVMHCSDVQFRHKPRRSPASLVAAVLRRAGYKQQRGVSSDG